MVAGNLGTLAVWSSSRCVSSYAVAESLAADGMISVTNVDKALTKEGTLPLRAPIIDNIVISLQTPGQTQSVPAEHERAGAAVQFGEVLQDVVPCWRHLQEEPDTPQVSGPRFSLSLSLRCSSETLLQRTSQRVLKLESTLLKLKQLNGVAISLTLPLGRLGIEQVIGAFLQAHGQGKERTSRIPFEHREKLLKMLEEQLMNWCGLPTKRHPYWSFPIVNIITAVTRNLTPNQWVGALRLLVLAITSVAVLAPRSLWRKRFGRKVCSSDARLTVSTYAVRVMWGV